MTVLEHPDVLVVDDNEDARYATIRVLERNGWVVTGAADATSAWDAVSVSRPRVVLLDVVLPGESGFDVLKRIRSQPDLDEMSVVMLSSMRTSIPDRTSGLNSGADDYLLRPIDNAELVARVRAQLRQHEILGRLRRSEQRYRDMIDGQVDGVLMVGHDGSVRYANPSADRLFSVGRGGLVDQPFGVPVSGGNPIVELRKIDGTSVSAEMSVVDTMWDDLGAWLITLRDISERLRLEEQIRLSQRLESVGQLTGGIAHDFNNLLGIILGASSELMSRTEGELSELSEMITQAARRGADLIRQLLAFASRQFLQPDELDVGHLVRSLLPVLSRSLGDTIDIDLVEDAMMNDLALVDRAGLESAILNLCLNGRDAMRDGGRVQICVAHHVEASDTSSGAGRLDPGEYVMLSVTDSGEGISPENLQRVLDPFYTTKPPGVGTGLGLPMVYGFVRQSGGHLEIDSELGRGTTVTMYLPATPTPDAPPVQGADDHQRDDTTDDDARLDDATPPRGRATVLVVDDDDLLRTLVVQMIERLGHEVINAATVEDARRLLAAQHVDLLLSDVRLGGRVTGSDLAEQARATQPELVIVLMSGLATDVRQPGGAKVHVLGKPFDHMQLREAIDQALGR